jgi:hypothetical protein
MQERDPMGWPFGARAYSVSRDGAGFLLSGEPILAALGGVVVDLVSAPLEPGEYRLSVAARMGGGEIYLPRCANLDVEDRSAWGGSRLFEGAGHWPRMRWALRGSVDLPGEIPAHALEGFGERPVTVCLALDTRMGGFGVYRL